MGGNNENKTGWFDDIIADKKKAVMAMVLVWFFGTSAGGVTGSAVSAKSGETRVDQIESDVSRLDDDFSDLAERINEQGDSLNTVNSQLTVTNERLGHLQTSLDSVATKIDAMEDRERERLVR